MQGQPGFFDINVRLKRLSDLGDQLEAFAGAVDFEIFCPDLLKALAYSDGAQQLGRPRFDPVGDELCDFPISDRLSFMRLISEIGIFSQQEWGTVLQGPQESPQQ